MRAPARHASSSTRRARARARRWNCSCGRTSTGTSGLRRPMPTPRSPKTIYPVTPVAGIREGNRLPTSPELQAVGHRRLQLEPDGSLHSYVRFTVQHVGSSFTQIADQEPNFGLISNAPGRPAGLGATDRPRRHSGRHQHRFRCRAAVVRHRQPALGLRHRCVGSVAVRQQPLGRARVPVHRPRARPQRARGLSHQPAAHVWREFPHELLKL